MSKGLSFYSPVELAARRAILSTKVSIDKNNQEMSTGKVSSLGIVDSITTNNLEIDKQKK